MLVYQRVTLKETFRGLDDSSLLKDPDPFSDGSVKKQWVYPPGNEKTSCPTKRVSLGKSSTQKYLKGKDM